MEISAEQLAYWYLRLNGFLTIQNFVVHPETGRDQRTDADILGVRFPHRAELYPNTMVDDSPFTDVKDKPYVIIAEAKKGKCALNGPWTDPERENLQRVLRATGVFPDSDIQGAAAAVYREGIFFSESYHLTLACVGDYPDSEIAQKYKDIPQILWDRVLEFIHGRFWTYKNQKISHGQWDQVGKDLWDYAMRHRLLNRFKGDVKIIEPPRS